MPTLEEARTTDAITRAEMAKMVSVYAEKTGLLGSIVFRLQ
jgi:hypothetical protein